MRLTRSLLLVFVTLCCSAVGASTFVVDSTVDAVDLAPGDGFCQADGDVCTLRAATMEANALPGHDTIEIPAGTYFLTIPPEHSGWRNESLGALYITDHVTINGETADTTIIDASPVSDRVVSFWREQSGNDPLQSQISGLTLTGGMFGCLEHQGNGTLIIRSSIITGCEPLSGSGGGSGIYHNGPYNVGRVEVIDSTVSNCTGVIGGGISNTNGELVLIRSVVTNNTAVGPLPFGGQWGGGVQVKGGSLVAIDSVISNNVAARSGGGIHAELATVSLVRTTVSGNEALDSTGYDGPRDGNGGGIWMKKAKLDVVNSTISGNVAAKTGAGIFSEEMSHFQIAFSTISANRNLSGLGGAGMRMEYRPELPWTLEQSFRSSIIAGNTTDGVVSNCVLEWLDVDSRGFNIDDDDSCLFDNPTDRPGLDPNLGLLADNGGLTHTHELFPGSVAMDLIPDDECHSTLDNDWDYRVDEDLGDERDNDEDGLVDEDPVDIVEVDQRGVARPIGLGCDAGAYEGGTTAETAIEALIVDVEALIEDGEIAFGRGRSLLAELQVALWFLEFKGGERIAIKRIELFIIKVERLIDKGNLDPEIGSVLLAKARTIIELLQ